MTNGIPCNELFICYSLIVCIVRKRYLYLCRYSSISQMCATRKQLKNKTAILWVHCSCYTNFTTQLRSRLKLYISVLTNLSCSFFYLNMNVFNYTVWTKEVVTAKSCAWSKTTRNISNTKCIIQDNVILYYI